MSSSTLPSPTTSASVASRETAIRQGEAALGGLRWWCNDCDSATRAAIRTSRESTPPYYQAKVSCGDCGGSSLKRLKRGD